jgi:hypothetical protein
MKNENHTRSGISRKLVSASVLFAVFSQSAFASASAPDTTATTRDLQEVVASLDTIIGNVSILAANTPTMPGYYDADASGRDISNRTLAGNSPRNVVLGAPVRSAAVRSGVDEKATTLAALPAAQVAPVAPAVAEVLATQHATAVKASGPVVVPDVTVAASPAIQATPAAPTVAAAPSAKNQVWTMKPNATVEETLAAWAHAAGWNPPQWQAATPYRIVEGAPIEGSFMDALRALANAMPQLDFTASPNLRDLVVSDAHK